MNAVLKPTAVPPLPATPTKLVPSPFEADNWQLRLPAQSPRGLYGPFTGLGGCLGGFMPEGRTMRWFDTSIAADDGDIVLVELDPAFLEELVRANRDNPEWLAKYGTNPPSLATKWLRHYRGEHYLCEEKHAVPLAGRGTVVGVCRYVLIDGEPRYGSGPDHAGFAALAPLLQDCSINLSGASGAVDPSRIDPEAATEVVQTAPADGVVVYGAINTGVVFSDTRTIAMVNWTNPLNEAIDAIVDYKGMFNLEATEDSGISRYVYMDIIGDALYSEEDFGLRLTDYVATTRITRSGSHVVTVPANGEITARIRNLLNAQPGNYPNPPDVEYRDVSISIKGIKR